MRNLLVTNWCSCENGSRANPNESERQSLAPCKHCHAFYGMVKIVRFKPSSVQFNRIIAIVKFLQSSVMQYFQVETILS